MSAEEGFDVSSSSLVVQYSSLETIGYLTTRCSVQTAHKGFGLDVTDPQMAFEMGGPHHGPRNDCTCRPLMKDSAWMSEIRKRSSKWQDRIMVLATMVHTFSIGGSRNYQSDTVFLVL